MVWPPHSSGTRPRLDSSRLTRSGSAPGLSILLTATMIGTFAALAWLMASIVCGITPSSAATTRMTMSVAWAPRARMAVNASWPGVSRNVTLPWEVVDLVGADVLGDAAGLALRHLGRADGVEERRLAVEQVGSCPQRECQQHAVEEQVAQATHVSPSRSPDRLRLPRSSCCHDRRCPSPRRPLGVFAEILLEDDAVLVDDEGHDAADLVFGGPRDERETFGQQAILEVLARDRRWRSRPACTACGSGSRDTACRRALLR